MNCLYKILYLKIFLYCEGYFFYNEKEGMKEWVREKVGDKIYKFLSFCKIFDLLCIDYMLIVIMI